MVKFFQSSRFQILPAVKGRDRHIIAVDRKEQKIRDDGEKLYIFCQGYRRFDAKRREKEPSRRYINFEDFETKI